MKSLSFILFGMIAVSSVISASAQTPTADDQLTERPTRVFRPAARPNLLKELGLTSQQIDQLKAAKVARRAQIEKAQQALRQASKALDAAVYADALSEDEVAGRLQALQAAQAEITRIRIENELAVRRILLPEQLVKFRELRRRLAAARRNNRRQRIENLKNSLKPQPADSLPLR